MQPGHGTDADGTDAAHLDAAHLDAADLWVRDPRTGEYRMRLPGEPAPARPAAPPTGPAARSAAPAAAPAPASTSRPGRAAQRRRGQRTRSGPWVAGVACFLLLVGGTGGYLLLRHNPGKGSSSDAAGRNGSAPGAAASASCSARPLPTGPVPEPAVTGAFLKGSRAAAINVRVTLLNGTGAIGADETVLTWLQSDKGFLRASNDGPAPATVRTTSLVYAPDHVDQARTLAAVMGLPATALHGDGKTSGDIGRMVLTLGQDFHGLGKPFEAPAPTATPTAGTGCGTPAS